MKTQIIFIGLFLMTADLFAGGVAGSGVTSFDVAGQPQASQWMSEYLTRFLRGRVNEPATYSLAFQALADVWVHDAQWEQISFRERIRNRLLATPLSSEGYVSAQQHPSSSQDDGWPFPVWPQVPGESRAYLGLTAGWHFYEEPDAWEIVMLHVRGNPDAFPGALGAAAMEQWGVDGFEGQGLDPQSRTWRLKATRPAPVLTGPQGMGIDPFNCPYIQIRWEISGRDTPGYMEWQRSEDADWSETRRMFFYPEKREVSSRTGLYHSELPLWRHPEWSGTIRRIRFVFPECEPGDVLHVNSVFTAWDTRHLVNNAIYIKAAFEYFRWTGDLDFLRRILPRLRTAMHYMMAEGGALEHNHIRCTWPGHDGRPGFTVHSDETKTFHVGHGKGGNYWDLLPFGWDDMYTTTHYYAALLALAQMEEAAAQHPGWAMPQGFLMLEADFLRRHAADVKKRVNEKFWNEKTGRFVGTIDADGVAHDYGFTFVNLEAIHYGIANEEHANEIMQWITGEREVPGDTSRGNDLYTYRLAPRATTKRNVEWYSFFWFRPEENPFGGQVQDGGAVLGFSFYDIMSRIKTRGADDAWARLMEIREWDEEVQAYGGYRKYYGDGKGGTTLQGGGTAGGIGIDFEFTESSMLSAVIPHGFMGLRPDGQVLNIEPNLPTACPEMTVRNLSYQGVPLDIRVSPDRVWVTVHQRPSRAIRVRFGQMVLALDGVGEWVLQQD